MLLHLAHALVRLYIDPLTKPALFVAISDISITRLHDR